MKDKFVIETWAVAQHVVRRILDIARCLEKTEEYGECLLWQGYCEAHGYPMYRPRQSARGKRSRLTSVRRDMFTSLVRELRPNEFLSYSCDELACINPEHFKVKNHSQMMKSAAERGNLSKPTKGAKVANYARKAKFAKLNIEKAREIRQRPESSRVLAAEYGVTRAVISRIRANQSWKEYGANPWGQLINAANDSTRRRA